MIKSMAVFGIGVAVLLVGTHAALAGHGGGCDGIELLGICIPIGSGGGGKPAPAPLLAAGIPAFTALGGGVLVSRLFRRRKPRA